MSEKLTFTIYTFPPLKISVEYRGPGIYDVKGSVPVLFRKLHHRGERGRKGRESKFHKIAPRTFDIINSCPLYFSVYACTCEEAKIECSPMCGHFFSFNKIRIHFPCDALSQFWLRIGVGRLVRPASVTCHMS